MTAYISQNAFWGLLISAVEVYKRECFGLLIGYRDRKGPGEMYIVEHAVPFQSAGRRHKGVVSNPRAHRRIERFLETTPQLSVIGKLGFANIDVDPGDRDNELTWGIGVQYDLNRNLGLRALWQRYEAESEIDWLAIGAVWHF